MTRTISLSDEASEALARLTGPGESFSDVALRLAALGKSKSILRFAGALKATPLSKAQVRAWRHEPARDLPRLG